MPKLKIQKITYRDIWIDCELLPTKSNFAYKVKYVNDGKETIRYVPKEDEKVKL